MKSIKQLQAVIDKISQDLDGIDTPEKLRQAEKIVEQIEKSQLVDILKVALAERWIKDMDATIRQTFAKVR